MTICKKRGKKRGGEVSVFYRYMLKSCLITRLVSKKGRKGERGRSSQELRPAWSMIVLIISLTVPVGKRVGERKKEEEGCAIWSNREKPSEKT